MCATSRMVVKRKGAARPVVVSCTLLPDDEGFEMGATRDARRRRAPGQAQPPQLRPLLRARRRVLQSPQGNTRERMTPGIRGTGPRASGAPDCFSFCAEGRGPTRKEPGRRATMLVATKSSAAAATGSLTSSRLHRFIHSSGASSVGKAADNFGACRKTPSEAMACLMVTDNPCGRYEKSQWFARAQGERPRTPLSPRQD
jgi:hypothetical protein